MNSGLHIDIQRTSDAHWELTGNRIHDPQGIFIPQIGALQVFVSKNSFWNQKIPKLFTVRNLNYEGRSWII